MCQVPQKHPTMTSCTASPEVYLTAALHAAAHPFSEVVGVLVGRAGPGGAVSASQALPLFHTPAFCSPLLEVALLQAEAHAAAAGLQLVGLYGAGESAAAPPGPSPAAARLADKLRSAAGAAVALVLLPAAFAEAAQGRPVGCLQARSDRERETALPCRFSRAVRSCTCATRRARGSRRTGAGCARALPSLPCPHLPPSKSQLTPSLSPNLPRAACKWRATLWRCFRRCCRRVAPGGWLTLSSTRTAWSGALCGCGCGRLSARPAKRLRRRVLTPRSLRSNWLNPDLLS